MMDSRDNHKRRAVMAEIQRRGLSLIQHGKAWRIYGLNVDIIVFDLAQLDPDSLQPYLPRKGWGLQREMAAL
jgi:hypothetical protein